MSAQLPANSQPLIPATTVVTADNFQSDTIIFKLQNRLAEQTIIRTFTIPNAIQRDFANFLMVPLNEESPIYYSIAMTAPKYKEDVVNKVIAATFTELINA